MDLKGLDEEDMALLRRAVATMLDDIHNDPPGTNSLAARGRKVRRARLYGLLARIDVSRSSNSTEPA